MTDEISQPLFDPMEVPMGDLISRVPELLADRDWNAIDLVRRGLSYNQAYRVARGEIEISLKTARLLLDIFGLKSLDQIFLYTPETVKESPGL